MPPPASPRGAPLQSISQQFLPECCRGSAERCIRCFFDAHVDRRIDTRSRFGSVGTSISISSGVISIGWVPAGSNGSAGSVSAGFPALFRFPARQQVLLPQFPAHPAVRFPMLFQFLHFCVQRCLKLTKIDGRPVSSAGFRSAMTTVASMDGVSAGSTVSSISASA